MAYHGQTLIQTDELGIILGRPEECLDQIGHQLPAIGIVRGSSEG
jgi:hypothetical protein